jgi:oligopeptidase A
MFEPLQSHLETLKEETLQKITTNEQQLEQLLNGPIRYQTFIKMLQSMDEELEILFTQLSHLNAVENSQATQEAYNEVLPIISEHSTKMSQDERIYQAYHRIKAHEYDRLSSEQQKLLDDGLLGFRLSGIGLEESKKERLKVINIRLSELANDFSQNILDATNAYEKIIDNDEDVKEIPKSDLTHAAFKEHGVTKYKFTLQMPSYIAYMTYGSNSAIREEIYKAYTTRAPQNGELIDEILRLKKEKSAILGFNNYAELSIATKMAKETDEVIAFLEELAAKSLPQAKEEYQTLCDFAGFSINPWDSAYYSEKLRKEQYDLDEEVYREYFEQQSVVTGVFAFLQEQFGIEFRPIVLPLWNDKAQAYDIYDKGERSARLYLDLEARENKRGGAWMHNFTSHHLDAQDNEHLASAFVVCNFPPSSKENPSLLRHSDVVTFFHEMGHAIHHIMSKGSESYLSGVNGVEWDGVEFPSQFLEEFAYESSVLKTFARHYQSGEVINDELIERLKRAKNFQSAMQMVRQLEFALFDFKLHMQLYQAEAVQDLLDAVRRQVAVAIPPDYNKFQHAFSHIFAGGYAAGYYSYKWAEVLSSDAFIELKKNRFDPKITEEYKEQILYRGAGAKMNDLFVAFLGREPQVGNLLKISGIRHG